MKELLRANFETQLCTTLASENENDHIVDDALIWTDGTNQSLYTIYFGYKPPC